MIYRLIGWYLKRWRIKKGYTLRKFCHTFDFNPSTISQIERGYYFKIAPEYSVKAEGLKKIKKKPLDSPMVGLSKYLRNTALVNK